MNNVIEFPMARRKQQMSEQETVDTAVSNGTPVYLSFNNSNLPPAADKIPLTPEKEAEIKRLLDQMQEIGTKEHIPVERFAKHLYMSDLIPPDVNSVIYNEAIDEARENLDKELDRMVETFGEISVRNFSELIAELVMIAVDVSHAEGLSEGFMLSDDAPDF